MSVTIADSVGYEGTVTEPEWAELMAYVGGRQYGVVGDADWKVTAGTADREVRIAPGAGFGAGVLDRTNEAASLVLPAPPSGSRWHLIHVHRDWGANASSFDSIAGSTTTAQIPARATTPGTADDQPLALARVQAGQSQVAELIDLRVWGGYGGAFAVDELVLQYLTQLGVNISISGVVWRRELNSLSTPIWVKDRRPQGGQVEGLTSGAIANANANTPLLAFTVPEMIPAGALLHIHADVEMYIPPGPAFAGFARLYRGDTTILAQRRWHSQNRAGRFTYPSVEVNLPVTQDIPAGTVFRFVLNSDPLSSGGVEVWHAFMSWGVS